MTCMPARWRFHWENKRHQCKKSPACHTVSVTVGVTGTVPLSDRYSSSVPTFTSHCYKWTLAQLDKWTRGATCYKWTRAAHCHEWVRGAQLIPGTQLWGAAGADDVCLYTDRLHDLLSSVFTDIFNTSFSSLEVFEERSAVFTLSLDRLLCDRDKTNVYFIFILTLSCGRKCPLSSSKRWIQYIQVSTRLLFQRVCPQCHS